MSKQSTTLRSASLFERSLPARGSVSGAGRAKRLAAALSLALTSACASAPAGAPAESPAIGSGDKAGVYTTFRLTADLSGLSEGERAMIPLLIEAAEHMDAVFWKEAWGDRDALMERIDDPAMRRFAEANYGPWDRLDGNSPFVDGVGAKPAGARFYPESVTKESLEAHLSVHPGDQEAFESLYTVIRRNGAGSLVAVPYSEAFATETRAAADLLEEAAALAEDPGLKRYLQLRAKALRTDDYQKSDMAWLDMRDNGIDVVIGPIETYEDQLYGRKAAHEAYVLIKDRDWSARLSRYAQFLPELQRGLPVPDAYKAQMPGTDTDLNAYDVVYYAGDCNAGSKTIAINLPNDEEVQLAKGSRRLQLKNAMRAKFDLILEPIADLLIDESLRKHVTFDAFFANTMFHEVAHGLGIKGVVGGEGTVREALAEHASALEEGKADVLGLYMVTQLRAKDEIPEGELMDNYVTFLASIFRSVRFGASSAHGKANMIRFNFFERAGAFRRDPATGRYSIDVERMQAAVEALSREILTIQGDGNYDGAGAMVKELGVIGPQLAHDLERLTQASIPVDIVFEQGVDVLGL